MLGALFEFLGCPSYLEYYNRCLYCPTTSFGLSIGKCITAQQKLRTDRQILAHDKLHEHAVRAAGSALWSMLAVSIQRNADAIFATLSATRQH